MYIGCRYDNSMILDQVKNLMVAADFTEREWQRFAQYLSAQQLNWNNCWIWSGPLQTEGYGYFFFKKNYRLAHRQLCIWLYGKLGGLVVDHVVCDTPACLNPLHLIPCTHRFNLTRIGSNSPSATCAQKTTCKYGHPLAGSNLILKSCDGSRQCRECCNRRNRELYAKRKIKQMIRG